MSKSKTKNEEATTAVAASETEPIGVETPVEPESNEKSGIGKVLGFFSELARGGAKRLASVRVRLLQLDDKEILKFKDLRELILVPVLPMDPQRLEECMEQGIPYDGLGRYESIEAYPIEGGTGKVFMFSRDVYEYQGTAHGIASKTCMVSIRKGPINDGGIVTLFNSAWARGVLELHMPTDPNVGLVAQFNSTALVKSLRNDFETIRGRYYDAVRERDGQKQGGRGRSFRREEPTHHTVGGPGGNRSIESIPMRDGDQIGDAQEHEDFDFVNL